MPMRRKTFRQILHRLLEYLRGFRHVTHVDADGRGDITVSQRPRQVGQQHDRQVIHAVKAHIFQRSQSDGFPRARAAADDHQYHVPFLLSTIKDKVRLPLCVIAASCFGDDLIQLFIALRRAQVGAFTRPHYMGLTSSVVFQLPVRLPSWTPETTRNDPLVWAS